MNFQFLSPLTIASHDKRENFEELRNASLLLYGFWIEAVTVDSFNTKFDEFKRLWRAWNDQSIENDFRF